MHKKIQDYIRLSTLTKMHESIKDKYIAQLHLLLTILQ